MSTSFPALMTRKRKVPGKRVFNAANVLADFIPSSVTPTSYYRHTFQSTRANDVLPAGRVTKPNTNSVCFLYENPRFVNEPICFANTKETHKQQSDWWTQSVLVDTKKVPPYKADTVSRSDYTIILDPPLRATRFGFNPHRNDRAKGIVPNNSDRSSSNERISFEHEFDCRTGRKERGKLHGSFVWDSHARKPHLQQQQRVGQTLIKATI